MPLPCQYFRESSKEDIGYWALYFKSLEGMCVKWISSSLTFWSSEPCRNQQSSRAHVKSSGIVLRGLTLVSCALWSGKPSKQKQNADVQTRLLRSVSCGWSRTCHCWRTGFQAFKAPCPHPASTSLGKEKSVTHCSGNWAINVLLTQSGSVSSNWLLTWWKRDGEKTEYLQKKYTQVFKETLTIKEETVWRI